MNLSRPSPYISPSLNRTGLALASGLLLAATSLAGSFGLPLMPAPESVTITGENLKITPQTRVYLSTARDPRVTAGVTRLLRSWEQRTGFTFARQDNAAYTPAATAEEATIVIRYDAAAAPIPRLGEDESYRIEIDGRQASLTAATSRGVLHGLATLQQLLAADDAGWHLPGATIADRPRFPWRGLMIDVSRHWQPADVIKRNLDAMALVKLNVLHLHLTDDQGIRIESRTHSELHERASDGHYFTQAEMRELIAYAAERGIRVVPEFDLPGHASAWVTARPEFASLPGTYVIERRWGVFDPVLDPTNDALYALLNDFLGEMAALFPDDYLHIGGDENNGKQWNANPAIQAFIRDRKLGDNAGLHAYFNRHLAAMITRAGKKLIGWDEILHPDLPKESVVHSWRGADGIAEATRAGHAVVLSHGYYIDLCHPASTHYQNDPLPAGHGLTPAQERLVLGGEATMWAEWVDPETIDSRIWPRTAAIAERLWSPRETADIPDMYRRLAVIERRLTEIGLHHESYQAPAIRRLAGDRATAADVAALADFIAWLEPVKNYKRGHFQPEATQFMPLTGLVDCTRPDSATSRELAAAVDAFLAAPTSAGAAARLRSHIASLQATTRRLREALPSLSPQIAAVRPLVDGLDAATQLALVALPPANSADANAPTSVQPTMHLLDVRRLQEGCDAVECPALPALIRLIDSHFAPTTQ